MPGGTKVRRVRFFQGDALSPGKIRGSQSKSELFREADAVFLTILFYYAVVIPEKLSGDCQDGA